VSPGAGRVYTLSPDRVKAIKDAGMWDDVAERNKMIKTYREYDRTNGRS
jgi:2-polyprenyl-6-methoxyphenol hydroxylase-like FAD-dependent oxidoreductase